MWKEVNLLSTNFSAKHTPSATLTSMCDAKTYKQNIFRKCISLCKRGVKSGQYVHWNYCQYALLRRLCEFLYKFFEMFSWLEWNLNKHDWNKQIKVYFTRPGFVPLFRHHLHICISFQLMLFKISIVCISWVIHSDPLLSPMSQTPWYLIQIPLYL